MKQVLNELLEHGNLDREGAYNLMKILVTENGNEAQTAALLSVFIMRDISLEELTGFTNALLELAVPFKPEGETIDVCGTGGDGKNTFNISTLSSFVVAAAGGRVVKHGNYGVSSVSGSSDVMEYLGYRFTCNSELLTRQLEEYNICLLHAPLFHPALKKVAPVRKQIGIKTFFNMLGPLVNPAQPTHRYTGTYNLQLARLYHYYLQSAKCCYTVVHSLDGYDEISLTGPCKVYTNNDEFIFSPENWKLQKEEASALFGGNTVKEAAEIFRTVLQAKGNETQHNVVVANAGAALNCLHPEKGITENIAIAREALFSGKAFQILKRITA